jgi:hypothetical protein
MNVLTEDNFILFAAKFYDNPQCYDTDEFYEDLNRFKYLKRLLNKYKQSGELKTNLILNHIVILNNLFGPEAAVKMIFLKCSDFLPYIKPFLIFLNICPDTVIGVGSTINIVYTDEIPLDMEIVNELRKIQK